MEVVVLIVAIFIGFVAGMYVTTQISRGIQSSINNKKLMKNLHDREKDS